MKNKFKLFPKKTGAAPLAIALAMFILALTGCSVDGGGGSGGGITPETPETSVIQNKDISQPAVTTGVYISGYYTNSNNVEVPCYWKIDGQNYKRYDLTDGTLSASTGGIAARGRVLYITGGESNSPYYPNKVVKYAPACYWKNGTKTQIDDQWTGKAIAVSESGKDVYVVTKLSGGYYWKNNTSILVDNNYAFEGIFVSGGNVYTSGGGTRGEDYVVGYWKNGRLTECIALPLPGTNDSMDYFSWIGSPFVSGEDVYVVGTRKHMKQDPPGSYHWVGDYDEPYCWKNGSRRTLPFSSSAAATEVCVSGNDVYVAGVNAGKLCYWKNETRTDSDYTAYYPLVRGITVWNGDVYIAGSDDSKACYWKFSKDGNEITLNYLSATDGRATGIAQVQ